MQEPFDVLLSGQPDKPVPPPVKQRRPFATRASIIATVVVAGLLATGGVFGLKYRHVAQTQQNLQASVQPTAAPSSAAAAAPTSLPADTVTLDPAKDYGNKYADGILPVGDKQYSTASAQKGKVYLCNANFVPESQAGAQLRGPWFTSNNTEWDSNKKVSVDGTINWEQQLDITVADGKRTITTNDLPDHHTGVFPVSSSDDAYTYDRNPNTISDQSLTYTLTELPTFGEPQCMGGEAGIMLTGAALFNAFDAGGRDAGVVRAGRSEAVGAGARGVGAGGVGRPVGVAAAARGGGEAHAASGRRGGPADASSGGRGDAQAGRRRPVAPAARRVVRFEA